MIIFDQIKQAYEGTVDYVSNNFFPESYGETLARESLDYVQGTRATLPYVDPTTDVTAPNVYAEAKAAVKETASAVAGFGKWLLIGGIALVVVVVVLNASAPVIVGRLLKR